MKICFFTENYYKGGLDTFLINLVNSWPDSGDELTLACNGTHPGLATIAEKTVRPVTIRRYSKVFTSKIAQGQSSFRFFRSSPVRAFFALAFILLQFPLLFPWYLFALTLYFRRSDFDRLMVVNGGYPASLLCQCAAIAWRLSGKRPLATFNFHNSATPPPWYFSFAEHLIDLAVIRSAAQFVSVSRDCLSSLSHRKAFLGYTKLHCIYNGIEDPRSAIDESGENGSRNAVEKYCLMLGTYESRKGHAFLLEAFRFVVRDFPEVHLRIYGYGKAHEKQRVMDEIQRLGLEKNVSLNDFTPYIASLIAGASVLVVPSQAYESFGLTIIEAMAFGTPVVTTDVGGMPEVLADTHAGYVCSRSDPLSFAIAIKNILHDPALALELGRNGRRSYEHRYSASIMAAAYMQILKMED